MSDEIKHYDYSEDHVNQILEIGFKNESEMEEYVVALCASGLADKYPVKFLGVGPEFRDRVNERVKY